ncbi:MAG: hypothetical protein J6J79_12470 [Lachnospiraceae bacterium]|nr:hypothetical protein [Lachnospiraceae bacterium]
MSYCVNCGVELESSLDSCPLCHTPVINPNDIPRKKEAGPYPVEKGQVDKVRRKDLAILTTVVLGATALSCLLLNLFVFPGTMWSLYVIGICIILLVLMTPVIIYSKFPIYIYLLFDGIAVGFFLYLITFNTPGSDWFFKLALPIIVLITILVEILAMLLHALPISFISTGLYIFVEIAVFCIGLELLIEHYIGSPKHLVWSAVVLTVCGVISILLATILCTRRLREAVRRRLHF